MPPRLVIPDAEAFPLKEILRKTHYWTSERSLRRMQAKYGIARQTGPQAMLMFSYPAVLMLQHGDLEAIELLREGKRDHPRVLLYLRAAGCAA